MLKVVNGKRLFFLGLSLTIVLLFLGEATAASNDTIYVNGVSGNDSYTGYSPSAAKLTIANAIVTVANGGTVNIAKGRYTGTSNTGITINKNMTITGETQDNTIIDAQGTSRMFYINSGAIVTIKNLKFTNGSEGPVGGGAINNQGVLTVTDCNFNSNNCPYLGDLVGGGSGGAIKNEGTLTATRCNFINNSACISGGAIYNGGNSTVTNCSFTSYNSGICNYFGNLAVINSTFTANCGAIYNGYGNTTVTGSTLTTNSGTIDNCGGTVTVNGSNFIANNGNINSSHGAIGSSDYPATINITNCIFIKNTATDNGGAIYIYDGTLTVTGSTFTNNTAEISGGAIYNHGGTVNMTNSTLNNNNAVLGGAIYNNNIWNINNSTLNNNTAIGSGGVIYNIGTMTVNFNRIVGNRVDDVDDIYNGGTMDIYNGGTIDATLNWWGTNFDGTDPVKAGRINSAIASWIILRINATPTTIKSSGTSTVTSDLTYDNNGNYHDPVDGVVPYTGLADFETTLGNITDRNFSSGIATSTLKAGTVNGVANVTAAVDNQIVNTNVTIESASPTVVSFDPINSAVNVARNKAITITFNEPIKAGNMWIELYNTTGTKTLPPITTSISGNVLTINHAALLATGTKYTLALHSGSITDLAGNNLAGVGSYFTTSTDATAPTITTTDPANNAVNVARDKVITVTLSEPIKAGTLWIELYNTIGTKSLIPITTSITGNVLTINHAALLSNGTKYTLALHTGSITDLAGNSLAGVARYFTTSTDATIPTVTSSDPVNNAVNVARNKVITVTFNEPIKSGTMWIELYNTAGTKTLTPITPSIIGNVLTINHAALLANGTKYTLCLHSGSVTDLAGNSLTGVARYFTTSTDATIPTVTSSDPVNNAVNVARNKVITVTFNEPIKSGTMWIELYNTTGTKTPIPITTSINGNVLTINHAALLATGTKYTLAFHTGSITDLAGNNLVGVARYFTTGTT